MKEIIVRRDNDRDLKFVGEVIASVSSSPELDEANVVSSDARWTELTLYKTQGGTFVCEKIERSAKKGEHDSHSADVCDDHDEVFSSFGFGCLAKVLYEEAKIDATECLD